MTDSHSARPPVGTRKQTQAGGVTETRELAGKLFFHVVVVVTAATKTSASPPMPGLRSGVPPASPAQPGPGSRGGQAVAKRDRHKTARGRARPRSVARAGSGVGGRCWEARGARGYCPWALTVTHGRGPPGW